MAVSRPKVRGESSYHTLARELREALLQGKYADGIRLPTEAELVDQYGVSRQTVRRAFHDLVSEGLVYRSPGRGTFAAERDGKYLRQFGSIEDLMGLSLDTQLSVVKPLARRVDVSAAGRLRLDTDAVFSLSFRRWHLEEPICYTQVSLPESTGVLLQDVPALTQVEGSSDDTIIGLLDSRLSEPISEAEQSVTAVEATSELGEMLQCERGRALLRIDRLYRDTTGRPVELAINHFVPDHYSYRVKLRRTLH